MRNDSVEGTPYEPLEELETTPYLSMDFYLNTYIVLTQRDRLAWRKVVRHKRDVDGNTTGQENQNPVLDNCQYVLESSGGEVMELTDNIIYEQMYAQYDKDRNDTLMINSFVNYIKTE